MKITRIVNCTNGPWQIANFFEGDNPESTGIKYYRFPVSDFPKHMRLVNEDNNNCNALSKEELDKAARDFLDPMFAFVDEALGNGESVLNHCLVGLHRAFSTSVACMMCFEKRDGNIEKVQSVGHAIALGQSKRPGAEPIGRFPIFLTRVFDVYVADN